MAGIFLLWCATASAAGPVTTELYRGNLPAALETARADAMATPDDLDKWETYLDLLVATGQAGRAIREAGALVKARPTDPSAHYLMGRAEVDAGRAAAAYERALRLDPDHARSHMGMGAVHTALGRVAEAEAAYTEALKRDGTLGEAWMGLVRVLALRGDPGERALSVARRGMVAAPDEPGLVLAVATLDPGHARELLTEAAATSDDARIHVRLAELELSAGKPAEAEKRAARALEIDPSNGDAERTGLFARTIVEGKLDLPGLAALLDARELLATDPAASAQATGVLARKYPDAAIVFLAWAEALDKSGHHDDALQKLALTLQRDPGLVDAQAAFGLALLRADRPAEAVPWLVKAVAVRSWDPELVRSLGQAQRKSGDLISARSTLEAAHKTRPWEVPTLLAYAEVLQALGGEDEAYAMIRDALRESADPRLAAAFVIAARASGHGAVAADFLEDLGKKSGSEKLVQLAQQIRAAGG